MPVKNLLINYAGLETPCLASAEGQPLLQWQLDHLQDIQNLVIVVGKQAATVMKAVLEKRQDAVFVIHHEQKTGSVLESLSVGVRLLREPFVYLEGSLFLPWFAVELMAGAPCPSVGIRRTCSEQPLCVQLGAESKDLVVGFTREPQEYEWMGMAKLHPQDVKPADGVENVHQALGRLVPVPSVKLDSIEMYTQSWESLERRSESA